MIFHLVSTFSQPVYIRGYANQIKSRPILLFPLGKILKNTEFYLVNTFPHGRNTRIYRLFMPPKNTIGGISRIYVPEFSLILSWRRPLSYSNQSIDLLYKSMDWFLYDNDLVHERVKCRINWKKLNPTFLSILHSVFIKIFMKILLKITRLNIS